MAVDTVLSEKKKVSCPDPTQSRVKQTRVSLPLKMKKKTDVRPASPMVIWLATMSAVMNSEVRVPRSTFFLFCWERWCNEFFLSKYC